MNIRTGDLSIYFLPRSLYLHILLGLFLGGCFSLLLFLLGLRLSFTSFFFYVLLLGVQKACRGFVFHRSAGYSNVCGVC